MSSSFGPAGAIRFLYNHNPFYLISACLVLYGVQRAMQPAAGELIDPWMLMGVLCGYTLLAAVTAWLIVRLGRVWEDARSLVLILLLLFFAISTSFDEIVNSSPEQGRTLLAIGFGLTVVVTEVLLRGLRVRFAALFRVPYYLILGLLFVWPLWVSPEVTGLPADVLRWRIALFPIVTALALLTLLPAVRMGREYVRHNGTPWGWPLFPWTAFLFLAVGLAFRSYALGVSFDPAGGMDSIFGLYFLVPLGLAVLMLLLEMGLVENKPGLQTFTLWTAPLLIWLAIPEPMGSPLARGFLAQLTGAAGSPLFLTTAGLIAFYGYAWCRGVARAEAGFVLAAAFGSMIGSDTLRLDEPQIVNVWPLAVVGIAELVLSAARRDSFRFTVGAACAVAVLAAGLWDSSWLFYRRVVPYHVGIAAVLAGGVLFRDGFSAALRRLGAVLLPLSCLWAAGAEAVGPITPAAKGAYLAAMTAVIFAWWVLTRHRWYLYAGLLNVTGACAAVAWLSYAALGRAVGTQALAPIAWGLLSFGVAVLICALKGGLGGRLRGWMTGLMPRELSPTGDGAASGQTG